MLHGRAEDLRDIGDPAASGGDGDTLSRLHAAVKFQPRQLGVNLAGDIGHARPGELLAKAEDVREVGHKVSVYHRKRGRCKGSAFSTPL